MSAVKLRQNFHLCVSLTAFGIERQQDIDGPFLPVLSSLLGGFLGPLQGRTTHEGWRTRPPHPAVTRRSRAYRSASQRDSDSCSASNSAVRE